MNYKPAMPFPVKVMSIVSLGLAGLYLLSLVTLFIMQLAGSDMMGINSNQEIYALTSDLFALFSMPSVLAAFMLGTLTFIWVCGLSVMLLLFKRPAALPFLIGTILYVVTVVITRPLSTFAMEITASLYGGTHIAASSVALSYYGMPQFFMNISTVSMLCAASISAFIGGIYKKWRQNIGDEA